MKEKREYYFENLNLISKESLKRWCQKNNQIALQVYGGIILKKYRIGYTTGVYDMFHIGHLNILKKAKSQCDYLIVGVTTDELVLYKNKSAIIPHKERMEIVESIKYVDKVVPQENMDKMGAWKKYKFDVMFVGSDWKGTTKWNDFERQFREVDVDIVYFPYTQGTSSTKLRDVLDKIMKGASV